MLQNRPFIKGPVLILFWPPVLWYYNFRRGVNKLVSNIKPVAALKERKLFLERKLIMIAVVAAIISFAGCSVLTVQEYIRLDQETSAAKPLIKQDDRASLKPPAASANLVKFLPAAIEGYNTQARQWIPGENKRAAEAIYGTSKEGNFARYNSYVKITYYKNNEEAGAVINNILKTRYPVKTSTFTHNNIEVHSGYDKGYGGYYLAFTAKQYLIEISTDFVLAVPKDGEVILKESAMQVLDGVSRQVESALNRG